jgi:hypothetical protein
VRSYGALSHLARWPDDWPNHDEISCQFYAAASAQNGRRRRPKRGSTNARRAERQARVEPKCIHRNPRLVEQRGIVTCADCHATLNPFWALSMLSEQYAFAIGYPDWVKSRVNLSDVRILKLSHVLDAMSPGERSPNQSSTYT